MDFNEMIEGLIQNISPVILLPNGLYVIPYQIEPQWSNDTPSGFTFWFGKDAATRTTCFVAGTWDESLYYDIETGKWSRHDVQ